MVFVRRAESLPLETLLGGQVLTRRKGGWAVGYEFEERPDGGRIAHAYGYFAGIVRE